MAKRYKVSRWLARGYYLLRDHGAARDLTRVRRILLVRTDGLGDLVLTSPLIRELRKNKPEMHLTLVVHPDFHNLVEKCPYADEVLAYDYRDRNYLRRFLFYLGLWRRCFDMALLPRWDSDHYHGSRLVFFSGAPLRVGFSEEVNAEKSRMNRGFNFYFNRILNDRAVQHELEQNLRFLARLGCRVEDTRCELWLTEEDRLRAGEFLGRDFSGEGRPLVAISPGAGAPKRVWPSGRYLEVCRALARDRGARFAVVGGPGEEALGAFLARGLGEKAVDLVNRMTLRQMGAVLEKCSLFLGNDSGPMHMAAAAGVPVVEVSCHPPDGDLVHANSPARFAPWGVPSVVVRPGRAAAGCTAACEAEVSHCILNIETGKVFSAAVSLPWKTPS